MSKTKHARTKTRAQRAAEPPPKVAIASADHLPICGHCGQRMFLTRGCYLREVRKSFAKARAVRYASGFFKDGAPVCNKCGPEVRRVAEWRAKK